MILDVCFINRDLIETEKHYRNRDLRGIGLLHSHSGEALLFIFAAFSVLELDFLYICMLVALSYAKAVLKC